MSALHTQNAGQLNTHLSLSRLPYEGSADFIEAPFDVVRWGRGDMADNAQPTCLTIIGISFDKLVCAVILTADIKLQMCALCALRACNSPPKICHTTHR